VPLITKAVLLIGPWSVNINSKMMAPRFPGWSSKTRTQTGRTFIRN
jgi:hypothetical protein